MNPASSAPPLPGSRELTIGFVLIGLVLAAATTWVSLVPAAEAVVSFGKLIPLGASKPVQHKEGGIVESIAVRDGNRVNQGAVLLKLDSSRLESERNVLLDQKVSLLVQQARFESHLGRELRITFPPDIPATPAAAAAAQAEQSIFENVNRDFAVRRQMLIAEDEALQERASALLQEAESAARQEALAIQEFTDYRSLVEKGFGLKSRSIALERQIEGFRAQRAHAIAERSEAISRRRQVAAQIHSVDHTYVQSATEGLADLRHKLVDVSNRIDILDGLIERCDVMAPISGRVFNLKKLSVSGTVSPNETIMEIVPDGSPLVAEVYVPPDRIQRIQPNQAAQIIVSDSTSDEEHYLDAQVETVSADRVEGIEGTAHFVVSLRFTSLSPGTAGKLRPGLPVEAQISVGERTVASYIARPLARAIRQALSR